MVTISLSDKAHQKDSKITLLDIIQKSNEQLMLAKIEERLQKVESNSDVELERIKLEREKLERRNVLFKKTLLVIVYVSLVALAILNEQAYAILNRPLTCMFPVLVTYIVSGK